MISEQRMNEAVELYTNNEYWKGKLDDAPTELTQRATKLGFYASWLFGRKEYGDERKEVIAELKALREQFGLEDWKHQLKYCGHNPYHAVCTKKIKELSAKEQ